MADRLAKPELLPIRRSTWGRYKWDTWFDGAVWRLVVGEDFDDYLSLRVSAYQAAARRGIKCSVLREEDGNVLLQARKKRENRG